MADAREDSLAGSIEAIDLRGRYFEPFFVKGVRFVRYHAALAQALAGAMRVPVETVHTRHAEAMQASLALLDDDRVAGYGWVSHDMIRIYELHLTLPIPRGHAYIWDCATLPGYRNQGIFAALLRFVLEDLRLQGDTQAWAAVAPGNEPSLRAFSRAGFRLVARAHLSLGHLEAVPTAEATAEEVAFLGGLRAVGE